jgi:DNA-binding beta-propeller fold protein YncE
VRVAGFFLVAALLGVIAWGLLKQSGAEASSSGPAFVAFESGPVRPVALSPDGQRLFVANTPNGTLEVIELRGPWPAVVASVPVGLEPVAVAARTPTEVWVVNHLSDSVTIVTLDGVPRVTRTLLVGDEPRDIVFAGNPPRAFITTAHRGQHRTDPSIARVPGAGDPQLTTPSVPRADVWVFDPANLDTTFGGTPLRILSFFTDTPRALAVSPDRSTVYVAGFKTGNQTTVIPQDRVCPGFRPNQPCRLPDGSTSPGGNPGPATNAAGAPAPEVGLIVKFNNQTGHWEDELRRVWDNSVRFQLPDKDVFAVDANRLQETAAYAHVGTTLFNMAVNPVSGNVYVSNTEAFNQVRFEGSGRFAGQTVQGHLAESRITVIAGGRVNPRHLNKHLDYQALLGSPRFDPAARDASLATPLDLAISADGKTLYVAAFGSSKIGVYPVAALEADAFDPVALSTGHIPVSGGGPGGLALDEPRGRLYVYTRFDNAVKILDLATRQELAAIQLANPEPPSIVEGRPMLYDATRFSANGEASCASCHIFGDMDDLAWDLGDPDAPVTRSPIPILLRGLVTFLSSTGGFVAAAPLNGTGRIDDFHPMKGPLLTQTLRGMRFSGAMHWRGDRAVGPAGSDPFDPVVSFKNFAGAFQDLLGSPTRPSPAEMERFAAFQLAVQLPPNPVRNLDNSLTPAQRRGADFYFGSRPSDGINNPLVDLIFGQSSFTCNGCHTLDPARGFFGTNGNQSFEALPQVFKVPHLRNLYARVGMFGSPPSAFFDQPGTANLGDQVRGYGFSADGTADTLFRFLTANVFRPTANSGFPQNNPDATRRDVEAFLLAFDTDLAPIVGQQLTLRADNLASAAPRLDLLMERAGAPFVSRALEGASRECDLIATFARNGQTVTLLYDAVARRFQAPGQEPLTAAGLRALAAIPGQEVTLLAAPPGSGQRYLARNARRR